MYILLHFLSPFSLIDVRVSSILSYSLHYSGLVGNMALSVIVFSLLWMLFSFNFFHFSKIFSLTHRIIHKQIQGCGYPVGWSCRSKDVLMRYLYPKEPVVRSYAYTEGKITIFGDVHPSGSSYPIYCLTRPVPSGGSWSGLFMAFDNYFPHS